MTSPVTPATHIRIQMAAISAEGIKPLSTGKDRDAQRSIERLWERKDVKRGERT